MSEQPAPAKRSWNLTMLTAPEPGRRNRRTIDAVLIAGAAISTGLAAVITERAEGADEAVADAIVTVLGWAPAVWNVALVSALGLSLLIVVAAVVRRRWVLVRDLVLALLFVTGVATVLGWVVASDWLQIEAHLLSRWGFPELRLAAIVSVLTVAGPELIRPVRMLASWLLALASVGAVALEIAFPSEVFGGLAVGLGAGAAVRLALGSPAGIPPIERVRAALASLGVEATDLWISPRQEIGAAQFFGRDAKGAPLKVRVLGRDAQDTRRLARYWRTLAYRDPPRSAAIARLDQVEHEALATLMAAQAGVRVPNVVTVGLGPEDDALVVTRQPDVEPLESFAADDVSDELLEDAWENVARLHGAGISHGRLNASNIIVVDGRPTIVGFSAATLGAPQSALDIDLAELLVACALLVGAERTLAKAVAAGWGDAVARILPYLQRAALTPHLRELARNQEVALKELKAAAAAATNTPEPEIAPLRRVRFKDVLLMTALVFAAYLLISQLADIGFQTIANELDDANVAWVVVGLILAQTAFIGAGISVRGAVATPLPLLPCVVLQSAIKFINLTVPSSAGRIGMNLRFLQQMGAPRAEAVAAGAVDDVSETMVQAGLFLLALPFVNANLDTSQFKGGGPDTRLLAAIGAALLISGVAVFVVPKLRDRVVPPMKRALSSLWSVARVRRKRVELFGGNVASELAYALALGATCLAYGVNLDLAQLVFVNTAASVLSSIIPSPGGIGAAEASLSAGLIAVGVDEGTAFAIALTQRLCTFYLPPIWGYFSLRWLSRKGYV